MEPLQPPSTQQVKSPVVELPHLVVDEPKRSKVGIMAVIVLSLLLLGLPVGIFLVSQRTQLSPQAAVIQALPDAGAGVFLESKLSPESQNGVIPVDIYIKSPNDPFNLVSAKISFDPSLVEVDKIATGSASLNVVPVFNKWIESRFDNDKGEVSIVAGLPTPGVKTGSPDEEKIYLGTLFLKTRAVGSTVMEVSSDSRILRNSDNEDVFTTGNDLVLNLTSRAIEVTPSPLPTRSPRPQDGNSEPVIVITSPLMGTNYGYFSSLGIIWSSFNTKIISEINLYVNGQFLGPIVQNVEAQVGTYNWSPEDSLALSYIQPANTFEIEIIGVSEDGGVTKALSGPFGILGTTEVTGNPPNPQTFAQNQLNLVDVSRALSNYLVSPLKDLSLDLNKDNIINELDLFLLRLNLVQRGVVR